ncbi:hypothetical protein P2318_31700 [Myxococcaceae bacterium GXIMD 01537]
MTTLAVSLGLSLTACDPSSSVRAELRIPQEAIGKPLIVQYVESNRLGRHGLPDPYVVSIKTTPLMFGDELPQSGPAYTVQGPHAVVAEGEGLGCGVGWRVVAWVDMNESEGFGSQEVPSTGKVLRVPPPGWDVLQARPDEGDIVDVSLELEYDKPLFGCPAGDSEPIALELKPYRP